MNSIPPAKRLLGLTVDGGWTIVKELPLPVSATGGFFSTGYLVRDANGNEGFLKALDYSAAFSLQPSEIAFELQRITESINFERELLQACGDKRLDRVVRAISSGTIRPPGAAHSEVVEYLIFELAITDARRQMDLVRGVELAWIFRTLHHIATGLNQLHSNSIAHQDVKPSNVLVFSDSRKLADLGRAWRDGRTPPHNKFVIAGDSTYAPPELLYGYVPPDERMRRFGCDLYHLGSMAVFFFARVGMTSLIVSELPPECRPCSWPGTFDEVLPLIMDAYGKVLNKFRVDIDERSRDQLTEIVRQLCCPDPRLRGHPQNRTRFANPYSLERYITQFDRLAFEALRYGRC